MTKMPRHWRALERVTNLQRNPAVVAETMRHYSISEADAVAMLEADHAKCTYFTNHLYQVEARTFDNGIMQICIRRRDGAVDLRDWRHFQQIKNEVAGPEREAFELYPAESRLVDTSNKFHLWVLPEGVKMPVGWQQRDVQYEECRDVPGMRQRKL